MANNKKTVWEALRVGLILLLICGVIAAVVSLVKTITEEPIEKNLEAEKTKAVAAIFGSDGMNVGEMENAPGSVGSVLEVKDGETLVGYCVGVSPQGYAGTIEMMVGVGNDGKIIGVEITAMTESGELQMGNRRELLDKFIGRESSEGVDNIAGASYSSKAVRAGVDSALSALREMQLIGGEQ